MRISGPIQPPPLGLLGLLQLKNVGRNPAFLQDEVSPSIEMFDFWIQGSLDTVGTFSAAPAAGTVTGFNPFTTPSSLTVPNEETWWVENFSCTFGAGVGGTFTGIRLAYQNFNGKTFVIGDQELNLAAQNTRIMVARRFWLPPGSVLGWFHDSITVAAGAVATSGLQFARMTV